MEEKKVGRPRKYDGTKKERRNKANAAYYKRTFKQLNIRIPFAVWDELQAKAEARNLSIRQFIMQKISE